MLIDTLSNSGAPDSFGEQVGSWEGLGPIIMTGARGGVVAVSRASDMAKTHFSSSIFHLVLLFYIEFPNYSKIIDITSPCTRVNLCHRFNVRALPAVYMAIL